MFQTNLPKNKTTLCVICTTLILFAILIIDYFTPKSVKTAAQTEGIFVPIVMYHSISRDEAQLCDYVISPITLEKDFIYLSRNGYTPIFAEDLINYVKSSQPLPEKPIMLTFDDGFENNFEYLLPLLEKYDFKATVSVVGSYTEIADRTSSGAYLNSSRITELYESCHVEIANHSYNLHSLSNRKGAQIITGESFEDYRAVLLSDLNKAQDYLVKNCKILPKVFTYPYGFISEPSLRIVKAAGFEASFGVEEKPNFITHDADCLYGLNRYNRPHGISTEEFFEKVLAQ